MKYSIYIIIFSAIGVSLFLWLSYFRRLKRDMLFKLAARQLAAGLTGEVEHVAIQGGAYMVAAGPLVNA